MKPTLSPDTAALVYRQLAVAARAKISPTPVLEALTSDPEFFGADLPPVALLVDALRTHDSPAAALGSLPELFPAPLVDLVAEAERAGRLPETFDALARDATSVAQGRAAIADATLWPRYIGAAYLFILAVLTIFVIPSFGEFYSAFGADLPMLTRVLITVADFAAAYGLLIVAALTVLWFLRGRLPQAFVEGLRGAFPGYDGHRAGRFATRLAIWLETCHGDAPLLRAAARRLAHDEAATLRACAARLDERLASGAVPSAALADLDPAPRYVGQFAALAERLPDPAPAYAQLRDLAQVRADVATARFARRLTLASYVVIGALLGATIVALYLPIFKIASVV